MRVWCAIMAYESPSVTALAGAYAEIALAAPPVDTRVDAEALLALAGTLQLVGLNVGEWLDRNMSGRWSRGDFAGLRQCAIDFGGHALAHLGACVAAGAFLDVPMPTADRLPALVGEYGVADAGASSVGRGADLTDPGLDRDQVLVEQFAGPLMDFGLSAVAVVGLHPSDPGRYPSEDDLLRGSLGAIGAAATLIAAIDDRPAYHGNRD